LGAGDRVVSHADAPARTDRWMKGQIVTTEYTLPEVAPGYRLEVGLYDAPSGKRLPVAGGGDSIVLPRS
jgi:hypothetical protein